MRCGGNPRVGKGFSLAEALPHGRAIDTYAISFRCRGYHKNLLPAESEKC
jgi:hypothetical protein